MAMAALNFADLPEVFIDDREVLRNGPSYTVDSLRELADQYPGAGFFLLMGEDQAARFDTWKDWQQIAQLAELAVAPRETSGHFETLGHEWHNHHQIKLTILNMPLENVSATDIRLGLKKGFVSSLALKPSVFQYIQLHHLYMDNHDRSF
jgi:nicotinate-nucleotide adenylyltransferase